ncbi:MAG: alpha/beta hydrolase [Gemmatimonadales bacterium]
MRLCFRPGEVPPVRMASRFVRLGLVLLAAPASGLEGQSPARPQTPALPVPYLVEELAVRNPGDGTTLTGTLTLPRGGGPYPAVLLVSGAGAQSRDYEVFGHRPFLVLADHLTRQGIAVLRVDDRGVGGSGGDVARSTVALAAGDIVAGVDALLRHSGVDPTRVGVVAHSEGGRIAPIAAGREPRIAFLVLLAPPALSAADLATAQTVAAQAVSRAPGIAVQAALIARLRELASEEADTAVVARRFFDQWDDWVARLPDEQGAMLRAARDRPAFAAQVDRLAAALGSPWNRELYRLDPRPPLEELTVPVLAVYGDRDRQAPPEPNIAALRAAWVGHPGARIEVLPGLNHFFQHATTGMIDEVGRIEETFAPGVMDLVGSWIRAQPAR